MEAFTDLEQSKKLTEILPLESADFFWIIGHLHTDGPRYEIIRPRNEVSDVEKYWPCWSVAALLDVFSKVDDYFESWCDHGDWHLAVAIYETESRSLVEACYEMIVILHKEKLL